MVGERCKWKSVFTFVQTEVLFWVTRRVHIARTVELTVLPVLQFSVFLRKKKPVDLLPYQFTFTELHVWEKDF